MSSDLLWAISKGHNSFVRRGRTDNGVVFSAEPTNVTNLHYRAHSGIVNKRAVAINANKNGEVVISLKRTGAAASKPNKSLATSTYKRRDYGKIARGLRRSLSKYSPVSKDAAIARYTAASRAAKAALAASKRKQTTPMQQ